MKNLFFDFTTKNNQAWLTYQYEQWRRQSVDPESVKEEDPPFVTISREYGCSGFSLGEKLADHLNQLQGNSSIPWAVYDKRLLELIETDHGIPQTLLSSITKKTLDEISEFISCLNISSPPQLKVYRKIFTTIRALAYKGNVILIGRGAAALTRGLSSGFHIRIYADNEWKVREIRNIHDIPTDNDAKNMLTKVTREREGFVKKYLKTEIHDPSLYDIMLSNSIFNHKDMIELITAALKLKGLIKSD
ncbi:MAG: cytidylate kinase-like family protein [bacterium]|nr:cytidylate kinase-like family protein [bacterium]